ncbi:MAG: allantoinase AllB [Rhodothermales bacterium]|nr:allantoinase AllB [Rhodothermales bacterium]MBO6778634.1 allantoinase AllB [Rhodothermales bacterium]
MNRPGPAITAIRSTQIVTPEGLLDGYVRMADGRIADLGRGSVPGALDVGDRLVLPGFVDPHVHINEPGRTEWEGFSTATRAAASAGITTLVDMPLNSTPVTTTVRALEEKRHAAQGKLWVDVGLHAGVVPGNLADLQQLATSGIVGAKAFMVDSGIPEFPPAGARDLEAAMRVLAKAGLPLLVHAELPQPAPVEPGPDRRALSGAARWAASRPPSWEVEALRLLIDLCRRTGCHTHVVHVASSHCLPHLAKARAEGLPLTAETCPHYLFFALGEFGDEDVRFKCAPPIRSRENASQLLDGLRAGLLDYVASDHSPAPPAMKSGGFERAWGGISSLALGPSVLFTMHPEPRDLADWFATAPARIMGLRDRGAIVQGLRADLVVFDPGKEGVIRESHLHTRHTVSPYLGKRLRGVAEMTFLAGRCVFDNGAFIGAPQGAIVYG